MDISVVIPAYNEEARLGRCLEEVLGFMDAEGHRVELIVVDDGSSDRTAQIAEQHSDSRIKLLKNDGNQGKGYSVRRGMLEARHELVLFSDADLSTPIAEIDKLHKAMLAAQAVGAIGSRAMAGSAIEVAQPIYRVAMGKVFNACVRLIALPGYADTQCGFKLFTRPAAQAVFGRQTFPGFAFDVEILFIAKVLHLPITEVPVRWIDSPETKVSPLADSLRMFRDLLRIRFNAIRGCYR